MSKPQAHLSVQKSRVKQYAGNKYYLQNGTEFELELFNPTQKNILAVISINGKTENHGLVIRPGHRFFLDRFVDVDRKFLFDTYEVDANNSDVQAAIANNGHISVKFFNERHRPPQLKTLGSMLRNSNSGTGGCYWNELGNTYSADKFKNSLSTNTFFCSSNIVGNTSTGDPSITYSSSSSEVTLDALHDFTISNNKIETGRIEAGSQSNQQFVNSDLDFESFSCSTTSFQILPLSQQPVEQGEVAMYCSKCGRRAKKGENFCPKCGNDLGAQLRALSEE